MQALRYYFRLALAFLIRFKEIILLGVFIGVFVFLGIRVVAPRIAGGNTEKIAVHGRFTTSDLPFEILNLIGEGLTKIDETGKAVPSLAKSWEVKDGGKTWEFELNTQKLWQDNTSVNSSSIVYSFEDAEVARPSEEKIIFSLANPFAPFPIVLSKPTFKKGLLGTGEWSVQKVSMAGLFVEELILKNENGQKRIYKFYPTEERAKLAYKLGEVDTISEVIDPSPFDKWPSAEVLNETNTKRFVAVFFNTEDSILSDKTTRQALSYAIDKNALPNVRTIGPLSPNSWGYNPQTKPYDYDSLRAKELLKGTKDLTLKLVTSPLLLKTAEKVAEDWEKVGIKTTVLVSSILPEEYQAYLAIYDIPSDPDQYSIWHSTQTETNVSKYKNPRIDKLLEDGRQEMDFEKRKKIYLDFQRFLLEDAPAAFLYHPVSYKVVRK